MRPDELSRIRALLTMAQDATELLDVTAGGDATARRLGLDTLAIVGRYLVDVTDDEAPT